MNEFPNNQELKEREAAAGVPMDSARVIMPREYEVEWRQQRSAMGLSASRTMIEEYPEIEK